MCVITTDSSALLKEYRNLCVCVYMCCMYVSVLVHVGVCVRMCVQDRC